MTFSLRKKIELFMTVFICLMVVPTAAYSRLSAEAELNYVNYDVSDNKQRHLSANSFSQRYSLLYEKNGKLLDGRLGRYDVALGYEFATFDTKIKSTSGSESPSQSRGHILYRGEVVIDPKELPLKLRMYSRDVSRTFFLHDSSRLLSDFGASTIPDSQNNPGNQIFGGISGIRTVGAQTMLATSIINGQHIDSGATLIMGVKNGMTNGYNELLRHFPMLMLDYRDQLNKDLHAEYPVHNRYSRLAFVSLNKKDNWFHYRHITYKDYIDAYNDYDETQIQLGTVDEGLQRRWVDFSNWLQISADGQLTKRVSQLGTDVSEEFSLNLFGSARRDTWEARTFNNFTRLKENNSLITYKTTLPVYANGTLGRDANWSGYASFNDNSTNRGDQFTTINSGYRIDAFRNSSFTLNHGLGLEHVTTTQNSEANIVSASVGATSTSRFSRRVAMGANYSIRSYFYDKSGSSSNFFDQEITANAMYILSDKLRFSLDQSNRFTSGRSQYLASNISGAVTTTPQYYDPRNYSTSGGSSYQSISRFGIAWNPKPRLNAVFSISEDIYVPSGGSQSTITRVEAGIRYTSSNLSLSSKNTYASGNSLADYASNSISSENSVNYIFNRNVDAKAAFTYYKSLDDDDPIEVFNIEQNLNYYYYRTSGVTRRLFEINQSFVSMDEVNYNSRASITQRSNYFSLGAKYYPLRQMMVAAGTRYNFVKDLDNYTLSYYGSIGVQFRLLEASLDYSYGKSNTDGRIEKRFSANVKKKF
ncbi:MAG: hypothetical protein A2X80_05170 [Geobacteraceae bacterium GWB2_52_12]|nr:MAG: hypothetical protein A2X80_05170 [Geobacteraceae bacterium GWB2_52_12]